MPRITRLTNFGFALFCLFLWTPIASGQPPAQNQTTRLRRGYCKAWSSDQATIYFSDVFEGTVPSNVDATRGIENLFEAYLNQSYGYKSTSNTPVVCVSSQSVVASEQSKQQDQALYTSMGKQLVETRWKLSRQQATALAALPTPPQCYDAIDAKTPGCEQILHPGRPAGPSTPPTPSAPSPANPIASSAVYGFCWASMGGYEYFSAPFAGAAETTRSWVYAFTEYLKQKYDYKGFAQCPRTQSLAEAQAQLKKMIDNARGTSYVKYVETGWVYTAAASPTASPAPATSGPAAPAASAAPVRSPQIVSAAPTLSTHPPTTTSHNAPTPHGAVAVAAGPPTIHAICWADSDPRVKYYSAVFDGTRGDYAVWMPAFQKFLEQKFRFTGFDRCNKQPTLADAQKYLQNMITASRSLKLADGTSPKIIETGWQYQ